MAQITTKELSGLSDLLKMEQTLMVKAKVYAAQTTDSNLKNKLEQISARHQKHLDELLANLK